MHIIRINKKRKKFKSKYHWLEDFDCWSRSVWSRLHRSNWNSWRRLDCRSDWLAQHPPADQCLTCRSNDCSAHFELYLFFIARNSSDKF